MRTKKTRDPLSCQYIFSLIKIFSMWKMNSNYEVSYLIDLKRKIITFEYHKHVSDSIDYKFQKWWIINYNLFKIFKCYWWTEK